MTRDVPPPQRPPILNDSFTATENIPPGETLTTLCHRLSFALGYDGPWVVGGWRVSLVEMRQAEYTDPLEADFRIAKDGREMRAALRVDVHPSGWIEARVTIEGVGDKSFFIERVYEEFEIWPSGSPCTAIDSGRMGKRCAWLQLEAEFWLDLAFLAEDRFITLEPSDPNR
jgi:hypothetical protein